MARGIRIRTALIPAEACNRMNEALRKLYSAILNVRDERNRAKRIENFRAVLEANDLLDDTYSILRYSILKNLLLHLQNSADLANKDPTYLEIAVRSASVAKALFEYSKKFEHESRKKGKFLKKESDHLKNVAQKMEDRLKRVLQQKLKIVQKKQQTIPPRENLRR